MKLREKIKWADPLTVLLLLLIAVPVLYWSNDREKPIINMLLITVLFFALIKGIQVIKSPGLLIENRSGDDVKVKPEEGCEPVRPSVFPVEVDGISTPYYKGQVFKVRSGTNVYVTEEGKVKSYSIISGLFNKAVNRNYFSPDEIKCWGLLF